MTLPDHSPHLDFCIIGTAKAATSSVFAWLARQKAICGALKKEPHYWCAPGGKLTFCGPADVFYDEECVTDSVEYEALFRHKDGLRGEASTGYLYEPDALKRIRQSSPDCKIIVILREPVARMYAAYRHLLRDEYEPARSFAAALEAEPTRITAGWGQIYHYRRLSRYFRPLQSCYETFERNSVLVLFFEELISQRAETLAQIAAFLGITPDDWDLPRENEGVVSKYPLLRRAMLSAIGMARPVARPLGMAGKMKLGNKALSYVNRLTLWKPALLDNLRSELEKEFQEEILSVESFLGRKLPNSWYVD